MTIRRDDVSAVGSRRSERGFGIRSIARGLTAIPPSPLEHGTQRVHEWRSVVGYASKLTPADLDRLRGANRRVVDPGASLYRRGSAAWRVNREAVTLLGGGRALLMQIAHPLIAAAVADHSRFRDAPLERLTRTLELTLTIAFDEAAAALRAVQAIERVHASVRGVLTEDIGRFPRGTAYDANDPALLFWVHATLVDSALVAYERFVGALSARSRAAYYEQSKIAARLFRIPEPMIPPTYRAFRGYVDEMVNGPTLAVGAVGRELASAILAPPLPIGVRQIVGATHLISRGLLPPRLRAEFGLAWNRAGDATLATLAATIRALLPLLPASLRFLPQSRPSDRYS